MPDSAALASDVTTAKDSRKLQVRREGGGKGDAEVKGGGWLGVQACGLFTVTATWAE